MAYTYITNIRHLIPEKLSEAMPDQVVKQREFFGKIIKAATAREQFEFTSGLPCRKRVNRKVCEGSVSIKVQQVPVRFIFWHCNSCEDGGRISDFVDTWYDLNAAKTHEASFETGEEVIEVTLNRDEYKALITPEINIYDPDSEKIIYSAQSTEDGVKLQAPEGEMENLIGFIAADGNHEKNRKRSKLIDSIHLKIETVLDDLMERRELLQ